MVYIGVSPLYISRPCLCEPSSTCIVCSSPNDLLRRNCNHRPAAPISSGPILLDDRLLHAMHSQPRCIVHPRPHMSQGHPPCPLSIPLFTLLNDPNPFIKPTPKASFLSPQSYYSALPEPLRPSTPRADLRIQLPPPSISDSDQRSVATAWVLDSSASELRSASTASSARRPSPAFRSASSQRVLAAFKSCSLSLIIPPNQEGYGVRSITLPPIRATSMAPYYPLRPSLPS